MTSVGCAERASRVLAEAYVDCLVAGEGLSASSGESHPSKSDGWGSPPCAVTWSPILGVLFFAMPTVSHRPIPNASLWKFKLNHYLFDIELYAIAHKAVQ
jgi:hypothetical protein